MYSGRWVPGVPDVTHSLHRKVLLVFWFGFVSETGSHHGSLAGLELNIYTRLAFKAHRDPGIKGLHHHTLHRSGFK